VQGSQSAAHIAAISYAFASETRSVRELADAGALTSDAAVLEGFGFGSVHVGVRETPYDLALRAASRLLEERGVDPESVGLLVYGGAPAAAFAPGGRPCADSGVLTTTARFRYPATRLQYDLGLVNASVLGVDSLACTTLFGAIRVARAIVATEGVTRVLCVAAEFYPADAGREALYNCTSDAACAILVERGDGPNRIVAAQQVTKGYYWDCDASRDEIVASYFPTAAHCIDTVLDRAGWAPDDVRLVLPHNVSLRSWRILLGLRPLANARLWCDNIARRGHTLAGDNFINLRDALDGGDARPGDAMLLFSYGYGAHWTALAVEA
jgi:3-oxoacyl-[acyl-carrier-protein] synthase-3